MEPNLAFQTSFEETKVLTNTTPHPDRYDVPLDISQFTDIVKLRGPENYEEWHQSICTTFQNQGVWELVTGSEQPLLAFALDAPPNYTYTKWQRLDKSLSALLGMTVERAILANIPENISIDAMYEFLQTNYQHKPSPQFPQLLKTLSRLRLDNFTSLNNYAHKFITVQEEMESKHPNGISPIMIKTLFLEGLGRGWEDFKADITENDFEFANMELIHLVSHATDYENSLAEDDIVTRPVTKRRGRPFCGHCNMSGHLQEGCWRLEGRSEEEIKIIRRTLNQDRSKRFRKSGGPLSKRTTRPRGSAPNRVIKP